MGTDRKKRDYGIPFLLVVTGAIGLYLCLYSLLDYRATLRNPIVAAMMGLLMLMVPANLVLGLIDLWRRRRWSSLLPFLLGVVFVFLVPMSGQYGSRAQDQRDERVLAEYSEVIDRLIPPGGETSPFPAPDEEAGAMMSLPLCTDVFVQGQGALIYRVDGDLAAWLGPIAGGINTKAVALSRAGANEWVFEADIEDPEAGAKKRLAFSLAPFPGDDGKVYLTSVTVDGERLGRLQRKAFLTRMAARAGLRVY